MNRVVSVGFGVTTGWGWGFSRWRTVREPRFPKSCCPSDWLIIVDMALIARKYRLGSSRIFVIAAKTTENTRSVIPFAALRNYRQIGLRFCSGFAESPSVKWCVPQSAHKSGLDAIRYLTLINPLNSESVRFPFLPSTGSGCDYSQRVRKFSRAYRRKIMNGTRER